jgi:hypothetical protein
LPLPLDGEDDDDDDDDGDDDDDDTTTTPTVAGGSIIISPFTAHVCKKIPLKKTKKNIEAHFCCAFVVA